MTDRPRHPAEYYAVALGVYLISRAALFTFTTAGEYALYQRYGDAARRTSLAELYRTRDVEYPHLAVWLGSVAGVVTDYLPAGVERLVSWRPNKFGEPYVYWTTAEQLAGDRFEVGLSLVLFAADAACLGLVHLVGRRAYPADGPRGRAGRLLAYTVFTGAMGLILFDRQDLVVGLFALLALSALAAGRPRLGYAVLVLGTAYKLVPALLLPVWVLAAAAVRASPGATPGRYLREVVREAVIAGLLLALWPAAVYLWGGGERGFGFLTFHSARGLQLEAAAAWPVLVLDPAARVGHGYGSYNLVSDLADRVAAALRPAMALSVLLTVAVSARGFWRIARSVTSTPHSALRPPPSALVPHVVASSLLVWFGFILTNKVGSPQYLLWVAPLVPLLPLRTWADWAGAGLLLAAMVATTAVFPCGYEAVIGKQAPGEADFWPGPNRVGMCLLALKSATLVAATAWLAVAVWRSPPAPPENSR
jgi:sorbitol-specific phosphotransferase system component IIC